MGKKYTEVSSERKIVSYGLEKGNNDTQWAGYNTYYNGIYDFAQLGISQGILGIGLTLLCKELNVTNEYLNFLNFRKW